MRKSAFRARCLLNAGMASRVRRRVNDALVRATGYRLTRGTPALPAGARVRLVVASTLSTEQFHRRSYLGRSLAAIPESVRPELTLFADNAGETARGLPALYNTALAAAATGEILVLLHDDVYLHDWHIAARAREAMAHYDVAGIAGAIRSDPADPSWYFTFGPGLARGPKQPSANLSGSVNHGDPDRPPKVQVYGRAPAACELLDGVLMIVNAGRVQAAGVRFDEGFRFHLYDLDFCRSARRQGMRLGTWPIAVTHGSRGAWDSPEFDEAARRYLTKWSEP